MDIDKKEIRLALVEKYLDAETTLREEKLLADYYARHEAEEDERAVAEMIRMERCDAPLLSDEGEAEFDRINEALERKRRRTIIPRLARWASGVAALIALLFLWHTSTRVTPASGTPLGTMEIAQNIRQMMSLDMEDILSITALPLEGSVLVEAELSDGTVKRFVMSRDEDMDGFSLLAIN